LPIKDWRDECHKEDEAVDAEDHDEDLAEVLDLDFTTTTKTYFYGEKEDGGEILAGLTSAGVNFINILQATFTQADSKSAKRY